MSSYAKIVRWSDEDKCYVGTCPGMFYGGVHGQNELKVYRHLVQVCAEWESYERRKPRSKKARHRKARRSRKARSRKA